MFESLKQAAGRRADRLLVRVIHRLAQAEMPKGVKAEPLPDGVRLSGRRLKQRLRDDAALRNFGR